VVALVALAFLLWSPASVSAQSGQGPPSCNRIVAGAAGAVDDGDVDRAEHLLVESLEDCSGHPGLLRELAALRFLQDRFAEAGEFALRLIEMEPDSDWAWDLLGTTRYLSDDPTGALRAWNHVGRPVVQEVRISGYDGAAGSIQAGESASRGAAASVLAGAAGVTRGEVVTPGALVRGERQLTSVPAISRARLDYRPVAGGEAVVEGAVVLDPVHPLRRSDLAPHALRALVGNVRFAASNPLGRLERWSLAGRFEGRLRQVEGSLAHPFGSGRGAWSASMAHEVGRFAHQSQEDVRRLERSGVRFRAEGWLSDVFLSSLSVGLDHWGGRTTYLRGGISVAFHPHAQPWLVQLGGDVWSPPDRSGGFARVALLAGWWPSLPGGIEMEARSGLDAVSNSVPLDLVPRFGSGPSATHLMRARSTFDSDGVLRVHEPGQTWVHGGLELRRWGSGPLTTALALAAFVDAAGPLSGAGDGEASPLSAIHVGAGIRARFPAVSGWLRLDWAVDPADGASRLSAGWVP
jgi:hypothetical protein